MFRAILLLLVLLNVSRFVDGKAVRKKIKPPAGPESKYSIIPQSNIYLYKYPATINKGDQSSASNSNLDEYVEKSKASHLPGTTHDIESNINLNEMFDSEFLSQDLQRVKSHEDKSDTKEYDNSLESDQVFLHHEKNEKSKYIGHKIKPTLPKNYPIVHSKDKEQSESSSISVIRSDKNTNPKIRHIQSLNATQLSTSSRQFETKQPFEKLTFDYIDYGSVPMELILDSNESLELNQNLSTEKEFDVFNFLDNEDINLKDARAAVKESDTFESSFQENKLQNKDNFESLINTEDKNLFKLGINQMFEASFDSFIFNPSAQPLEKFQDCTTPQNESGSCKYVQHCMLSSILTSIQHFMENVCVIEGRFVGVCCPKFPVQTVLVNWEDQPKEFQDRNDSVEIPKDCGVGTNTRIVGGTNADRKAWLWMVALLNSKKKFFCGGSLINNQYVLTAAHCTFGTSKDQIVARLGEYDFNDPREPHDDYRVVEIKRHGQYNSMSLRNDIALLKLEKPVAFNEFVKTICFPEAEKDYVEDVATLVGWGHLDGDKGGTSDVLQVASFPVISNDQCSTLHKVPIPSSLICAAAVSRDKGACNGDSGGPLMLLDENDRWKVIGIVSWGRRGCNPKFPTVYTRITHFMDWIRKHST